MLSQYKSKTNLYIGIGLVLQIAQMVFFGDSLLGLLSVLVGWVLFIIGCCCYSKGKGHSAAWGLLGLLSLIGLVLLVMFPDKNK